PRLRSRRAVRRQPAGGRAPRPRCGLRRGAHVSQPGSPACGRAADSACQRVLAPALLYGLFVDDPGVAAAIASRDWDVAAPVVGYALLFAAWRLWRCSRRYDAVSAEEAMALDQRPPVLYLRSFHDDD